MNFFLKPDSVETLLSLVTRVPSGRKILEAFLPLYRKGKVKIEAYPPEIVARLREALGPEQPIGACFVHSRDQGTIYLDLESPIGVLVPFLCHEIIHSLDPAIWNLQKRPHSTQTRDQVVLQAETKAFEYQHRIVQELSERFPSYRQFLASYLPKARILHERLTSTDVEEIYGLTASVKH